MTEPSIMRIVPMARAHITELMRFEREMFGSEAWTAAAYREELGDHLHRYYIAAIDDGGGLLGWAGIRLLDDEAEILTVGVVPAARRHGIGSALLRELLDEAVRRGVEEIFLDVSVDNPDAQRIYEREGFARVGVRRGYYNHGRTDSLTMSLRLAPIDDPSDDPSDGRADD
jgi:ribosomal-protein-alanine N-acetyltransferase